MATKTVILRPDATHTVGNNYLFPSDVDSADAYLLVNEIVADDDATYVWVNNSLMYCSFYFTFPTGRIISAVIHFRAKSAGDATLINNVQLRGLGSDDSAIVRLSAPDSVPIVGGVLNEWSDYTVSFPAADDLNNTDIQRYAVFVGCGSLTSSSTKGGVADAEVRYTQLYLELTYEEADSGEALYIRENGTWEAVKGTVYRKENGAWVESNTDVFAEGDKFTLVTV